MGVTPGAHARLLLDFLTQRGIYDHVVAAVYDDDEACAAVRDYLRQVILEEREACAQLTLSICPGPCGCGAAIATSIRARA